MEMNFVGSKGFALEWILRMESSASHWMGFYEWNGDFVWNTGVWKGV